MSIESNLKTLAENSSRIADALEKLVENGAMAITGTPLEVDAVQDEPVKEEPKKPAAKPAAKKPAAKKDEPKEEPAEDETDPLDDAPDEKSEKVDKEMVRKALMDYREIEGSAAMLALLAKHGNGADGIGGLDEANYGDVYRAAKAG